MPPATRLSDVTFCDSCPKGSPYDFFRPDGRTSIVLPTVNPVFLLIVGADSSWRTYKLLVSSAANFKPTDLLRQCTKPGVQEYRTGRLLLLNAAKM